MFNFMKDIIEDVPSNITDKFNDVIDNTINNSNDIIN